MSVTSCTVWCITNLLFFLHCQPTEYFLSHSYLIINDVQDPFSSRYSPRGIFCSRTLNFRSISAIGYDMDYTLVHYNVMVIIVLLNSFVCEFKCFPCFIHAFKTCVMEYVAEYSFGVILCSCLLAFLHTFHFLVCI